MSTFKIVPAPRRIPQLGINCIKVVLTAIGYLGLVLSFVLTFHVCGVIGVGEDGPVMPAGFPETVEETFSQTCIEQ